MGLERCAAKKNRGNQMRAKHYLITRYWLEYYADSHCTLCGNSGVIDTAGVRTAAGKEVGRKNYCICPNGQALRKYSQMEATK
jgi:hypothetical protein